MPAPTVINLNNSTPAAPSGKQLVLWQADANNPRNVSAYPQAATASLEGTIKLTTDLGGAADTPEVVGLQGIPFSGSPSNGYVPVYVASGPAIEWAPGSGITSLAPFNNMLAPSITPPVLSSLTWGNQGTATAALNSGGALYFSDAAGSGSDNLRFLYKSSPATPYTFVIGLIAGLSRGEVSTSGILLRESSTGKIIFYGTGTSSNPPSLFLQKFTNYTTFSAAYFATVAVWPTWITWISVKNDGTNLTWSAAIDGQNFKEIYQSPVNNFFTTGPDEVGIGIDPNTSDNGTDALFVHWAGI